jgi:hypothetical protein
MNLENHGAQMTLSSRHSWGPITAENETQQLQPFM